MMRDTGPAARGESKALTALIQVLQSGRPLIYVCSAEESRIHRLLGEASRALSEEEVPTWTWSLTGGLRGPGGAPQGSERLDAPGVLDFIREHEAAGIFELRDFHGFLRDSAEVRRRIRDLYWACLDRSKFVVLTSPVLAIPDELVQQVALVELQRPDLQELQSFLHKESEMFVRRGHPVDTDEETVFTIARTLQGLTLDEARHALRRAIALGGGLTRDSLPQLLEEKKLLVNRSGLVQYVSDGTTIDHVGGLPFLKKWLLERRKLFMQRESLEAEIVPKGLLIMGVSGCGKSLSVKAVAQCFQLPLYRIDMIEVFSGLHGNPDRAFVEACRTVESVAPAVVWFDEIEMGLTAESREASKDMGRIFAFFLTWMQEKSRGLFVAATANRIDLLPAEMIRKGRFDEVFFIDLPGDEERSEIFRIHLGKRGFDPEVLQVNRLKIISQGWTGAEIEQCVVASITVARLEDRPPSFEDLHRAAQNVIPLSKTMREQVDHIRSWAYDRAVRASPRESGR